MLGNREEHQPIVIPMEDDLIHIQQHPFCSDPVCSCKEDPELLSDVARAVELGLLTPRRGNTRRHGQDCVGARTGAGYTTGFLSSYSL